MPRGDGTGPAGGGGPGTGRGRGQGIGQGRGRMGGPFATGSGGYCVCPQCGKKIAHTPGQICNQLTCPECGVVMTRE